MEDSSCSIEDSCSMEHDRSDETRGFVTYEAKPDETLLLIDAERDEFLFLVRRPEECYLSLRTFGRNPHPTEIDRRALPLESSDLDAEFSCDGWNGDFLVVASNGRTFLSLSGKPIVRLGTPAYRGRVYAKPEKNGGPRAWLLVSGSRALTNHRLSYTSICVLDHQGRELIGQNHPPHDATNHSDGFRRCLGWIDDRHWACSRSGLRFYDNAFVDVFTASMGFVSYTETFDRDKWFHPIDTVVSEGRLLLLYPCTISVMDWSAADLRFLPTRKIDLGGSPNQGPVRHVTWTSWDLAYLLQHRDVICPTPRWSVADLKTGQVWEVLGVEKWWYDVDFCLARRHKRPTVAWRFVRHSIDQRTLLLRRDLRLRATLCELSAKVVMRQNPSEVGLCPLPVSTTPTTNGVDSETRIHLQQSCSTACGQTGAKRGGTPLEGTCVRRPVVEPSVEGSKLARSSVLIRQLPFASDLGLLDVPEAFRCRQFGSINEESFT
jgi:hypothetical protein